MSSANAAAAEAMDPRTQLAETSRYTNLPNGLVQAMNRDRLSLTAVTLYMLHWQHGQIAGTWCSRLSRGFLREITGANDATISRAYKRLEESGYIRRTPGLRVAGERDRMKPTVPTIEVLIPQHHWQEIWSARNLARRGKAEPETPQSDAKAAPNDQDIPPSGNDPEPDNMPDQDPADLEKREALAGKGKSLVAQWLEKPISKELQWALLRLDLRTLENWAATLGDDYKPIIRHARAERCPSRPARKSANAPSPGRHPSNDRPNTPDILHLIRRVKELVRSREVTQYLTEIWWSVTQGPLAHPDRSYRHRINAALKIVRQGHWSRPLGMPGQCELPEWVRNHR